MIYGIQQPIISLYIMISTTSQSRMLLRNSLCGALLIVLSIQNVSAWTTTLPTRTSRPRMTTTARSMGLLDSISGFLQNRDDDFIKLESSEDAFGPGPAILLYSVPVGVTDDEIQDMVEDGAPVAFRKGCKLCRVTDSILDQSLQDALNQVAAGKVQATPSSSSDSSKQPTTSSAIPVLFFSGFGNQEMLDVYNTLGQEIYQETGGQASAACAKAVPNAMEKSCRQLMEEISGDHRDAMKL